MNRGEDVNIPECKGQRVRDIAEPLKPAQTKHASVDERQH